MRKLDAAFLAMIGLSRQFREGVSSISGKDITLPSIIHVNLTHRCNYKCQFCHFSENEDQSDPLSAADWKRILSDLHSFSPKSVFVFIGGEPFLRRDFLELAEWSADKGLKWSVVTNGYRLIKDADRIAAARPMSIDVSLDGASAEVHDRSRGIPGSFAKVTEGVAALAKVRAATGGRFSIRLKTTVHKFNLHELEELTCLTTKIGADSIDFSMVRGASLPRVAPWLPDAASQEARRKCAKRLIELKHAGAPIETSVEKLTMLASDEIELTQHGVKGCKAPVRNLQIDAHGNARFCWFHPELGNFAEESAHDIWRKEESMTSRKQALNCSGAGSEACASSCLAHRTFRQNLRRIMLHL